MTENSPIDPFDQNPMKKKMLAFYQNINKTTTNSNLSIDERFALFEICLRDLEPSRSKINVQFVFKDLLKLVKNLAKNNDALRNEIDTLKRSPPPNNQQPFNNQQRSYSDALQNKKQDCVLVIKKKDSANQEVDLFRETDLNLKKLKKDISVSKIKNNKFSVIVNVADDKQREKIINEINKSPKFFYF